MPSNFKETKDGLLTSQFGLTTFLHAHSNEGDYMLYNILKHAALTGACNVFYTSSFCRGQRSERLVGAVIDSLVKKYRFSREEFLLVSEIGPLSHDEVNDTPIDLIMRDIIKEGVLKESDVLKKSSY